MELRRAAEPEADGGRRPRGVELHPWPATKQALHGNAGLEVRDVEANAVVLAVAER